MNICKVHNVSNYVRNDHLTAVIEVRLYQLVACDSFGMIGAKKLWLAALCVGDQYKALAGIHPCFSTYIVSCRECNGWCKVLF